MAAIVVVDDDAQVRMLIAGGLKKAGHVVLSARTVAQALAHCAGTPIDLVIMDILMPDVDGIEGIREFRRRFPGTKLLAMSGGSERIGSILLLEAAELLGAAGALQKPFPMAALVSAVAGSLHRPSEAPGSRRS